MERPTQPDVSLPQETEINSIVAAVAALLGVALGGYIESLRSRRLFQSAQRTAYLDLEVRLVQDLFEVVTAHRHAYAMAIVGSLGALRGLPEDAIQFEKIPWNRLKMLVGLYAPDLGDIVKQFDDQVGYVGMLMVTARTGKSLPDARKQELIDKLETAHKRLDVIYDTLEAQLFQHAERVRDGMRRDAGLLSFKIGSGAEA